LEAAEKIYFRFESYTLFALKWGKGRRNLLAFHGFGQHAEVYQGFQTYLEGDFTVYSIEHFHHGRSEFPKEIEKSTHLKPEFYFALFDAFCKEFQIEEYYLMGYSLGGKSVLSYFEHKSEPVRGLCLLAPDGIIESGWYKIVSRYWLGDFLYRKIIDYPKVFFGLLGLLNQVKLVNDNLYKFVKGQLSTKGKRKLVFHTWRTYALLRPDVTKIKTIINDQKIPAMIFTGKFDNVLHPKIGRKFVKNLHSGCSHVVLEAGHDLLRPKLVKEIAECLKVNFTDKN